MKLTEQQAWKLAKKHGKSPPYRGYAMHLGNGLFLTHTKTGIYIVLDSPLTLEKIKAVEETGS